jgi:hypothetical protein
MEATNEDTTNGVVDNSLLAIRTSTTSRSRSRSSNSSTLIDKKEEISIRKGMLDRACKMYADALAKATKDNPSKNVPPNTFSSIAKTFGHPTWMDRQSIYYHYRNYYEPLQKENNPPPEEITVQPNNPDAVGVDSELSQSVGRNMGGRPSGCMSALEVKQQKKKLDEATYIASKKYATLKETGKKIMSRCVRLHHIRKRRRSWLT